MEVSIEIDSNSENKFYITLQSNFLILNVTKPTHFEQIM